MQLAILNHWSTLNCFTQEDLKIYTLRWSDKGHDFLYLNLFEVLKGGIELIEQYELFLSNSDDSYTDHQSLL